MILTHNPWTETPAHLWPLRQHITLEIQGKLLTLKIKDNLPGRATGKTRSNIGKFTDSSRLRLLKFIARIDWTQVMNAVFITLTYPDDKVIRTSRQRNTDRYLFWRYLEKRLARKIPGLWRLEWKARQSGKHRGIILPHFHLLAFNVANVPHKVIREWWRTILGHEGPLATDIRGYTNAEKAAVYAAKYASKGEELPSLDYGAYLNICGRSYGYLRKGLIPLADKIVVNDLSDREIRYLMRAASERLEWVRPGTVEGFSLLGEYAVDVAKNLFRISLDKS